MGFTKIFNSIRSSTMLPSDIENVSLKRIIPKINEWNIDTVLITANRNCTACKQYNQQVFSLYGKNKNYPKLPDILYQRSCPVCDKIFGATIYGL